MKKHYAAYAVVGILILLFGSVTSVGNEKCEQQKNMPFLAKILQAFGIGKTNCSGNEIAIENSVENKMPNGNIRLKKAGDMTGIAMPKLPSVKRKAKDAKPCAEDDVVCLEAEFDGKKVIDPNILDDGKTSAQFNCEEVEEKSGKETVKRQYCEGYIK